MEYTLLRQILILYRQNMTKKLSIIALMGLSVVLAGCSLPGTQDPQIAAQTQMIQQMQIQINSLLSGVDTLKAENAQLSGMLAKVTSYVDTQTQTQAITTHGSAPLLDSGSIDTGLVDTGIVATTSGSLDTLEAMTGVVVDTGIVPTISGSKDNSGTKSVLDELKKASEAKKIKAKTGTVVKIPTPNAIK
jgi:outer membrane murein-binding lipoprotein Lpp